MQVQLPGGKLRDGKAGRDRVREQAAAAFRAATALATVSLPPYLPPDAVLLADAGGLAPATERLLFAPTRPPEELYRWREDRWQLENLAADPVHTDVLAGLRGRLDRWMTETADRGPESDAMYDSDMKVYVGKGRPEVEANIATMKRWASEGK